MILLKYLTKTLRGVLRLRGHVVRPNGAAACRGRSSKRKRRASHASVFPDRNPNWLPKYRPRALRLARLYRRFAREEWAARERQRFMRRYG